MLCWALVFCLINIFKNTYGDNEVQKNLQPEIPRSYDPRLSTVSVIKHDKSGKDRVLYYTNLEKPIKLQRQTEGFAIGTEVREDNARISLRIPMIRFEKSNRLSCEPSITTVNHKQACKGELIFEDNFDSFNKTKWEHEIRISNEMDDNAFVSFQKRPENCYVNNGQLHIVPSLLSEVPGFNNESIKWGTLNLKKGCIGYSEYQKDCLRVAQSYYILPPVVSARLRTRDFFNFRYGRVEVRAKLPKGDWLFPLILLEPGTCHLSGQMRIAFSVGNQELTDKYGNDISGHQLSGGVIFSPEIANRHIGLRTINFKSHLGDDFHVYSLIWANDTISLKIDDVEYGIIGEKFSQNSFLWENGQPLAPFDKEVFLALGVSVGGHFGFPDKSRIGRHLKSYYWNNTNPKAESHFWNWVNEWHQTWKGQNAGLHVDYVKVYAL